MKRLYRTDLHHFNNNYSLRNQGVLIYFQKDISGLQEFTLDNYLPITINSKYPTNSTTLTQTNISRLNSMCHFDSIDQLAALTVEMSDSWEAALG